MQLLKITDFGPWLWVLIALFVGLAGWLIYQGVTAKLSGWQQQKRNAPGGPSGNTSGTEKTKGMPASFWMGLVVLLVLGGVLLLIRSDYKPGPPVKIEKLNDGRGSAEDQLKK